MSRSLFRQPRPFPLWSYETPLDRLETRLQVATMAKTDLASSTVRRAAAPQLRVTGIMDADRSKEKEIAIKQFGAFSGVTGGVID
jgi:hypothetical protein